MVAHQIDAHLMAAAVAAMAAAAAERVRIEAALAVHKLLTGLVRVEREVLCALCGRVASVLSHQLLRVAQNGFKTLY